jgi:hypothetical protein
VPNLDEVVVIIGTTSTDVVVLRVVGFSLVPSTLWFDGHLLNVG